jgi:purine-binding chemotaxis protein CheW
MGNLLFALDSPRYAIPLSIVERVVRAVEIRPLPLAPRVVVGVINAGGRIIPVADIRAILGLPAREMDIGDQLIIARTPTRVIAVIVDDVIGIRESPEGAARSAEAVLPFAQLLRGAVQIEDDIVLIYDLDRLLSLDEERQLDGALSEGGS